MPRDRSSSNLIPIGWIGRGRTTDGDSDLERYALGIAALGRGCVTAVYADSREDADLVAGRLGGVLHRSWRSFQGHAGLRAILCLGGGWLHEWGIRQLMAAEVPTLVGHPLATSCPALISELAVAEQTGRTVMIPAATWRFTPATLRIRELLATRAGAIRRIEASLASEDRAIWLQAIDWCGALIQGQGGQLIAQRSEPGAIHCHGTARSPLIPPAEVVVRRVACSKIPLDIRIETQAGWLELIGDDAVRGELQGEPLEESLAADRTAERVMLDLFLRRVVGGLVPVPRWVDLHAACELWAKFSPHE